MANSSRFKKGCKGYWLGKKRSKETKKKMSEAGKNKVFTREHKRNISQSRMGIRPTEETRKKLSRWQIGKKFSLKTREKISKAKKGRNRKSSSNLKVGVTPILQRIRNSWKSREWRQRIFIRDKFTCQKCGDKTGGNLNAHHIKPFIFLLRKAMFYLPLFDLYDAAMGYSPLWDIDNGITLCVKCHRKVGRK